LEAGSLDKNIVSRLSEMDFEELNHTVRKNSTSLSPQAIAAASLRIASIRSATPNQRRALLKLLLEGSMEKDPLACLPEALYACADLHHSCNNFFSRSFKALAPQVAAVGCERLLFLLRAICHFYPAPRRRSSEVMINSSNPSIETGDRTREEIVMAWNSRENSPSQDSSSSSKSYVRAQKQGWELIERHLLPAFAKICSETSPEDCASVILTIARAGGRIRQEHLQLLLESLVTITESLVTVSPSVVSNVLWGIAKMHQQLPPEPTNHLISHLVQNLALADPGDLSKALLSLAKAGSAILQSQLQLLIKGVASKLSKASPQCVANTIWAAASLSPQPLLPEPLIAPEAVQVSPGLLVPNMRL
jgi:hypothetical protein